MAIDFDKYRLSTGTHYIANSGSDENGAYRGGKAGDQTGKEWQLRSWYNRPWTVVLRYPDQAVADRIAELGIAAALNDRIGYDQGQRATYWTQLKAAGFDPSKITAACEADCTAGVSANVRAAGYSFGIEALKGVPICTSRNMRSQFIKAGFTALTASKYLTSSNYLLPGDILLYENHHAATNVTCGKAVRNDWHPSSKLAWCAPGERALMTGMTGADVAAMQQLLLKWNAECLPLYGADGDFGAETEAAVRAYQIATGLEATGVCDAVTLAALAGKPLAVEITGGMVNVRSAPSTEDAILGVARLGDRLEYQGKLSAEGWFLVIYNNRNGWVSGKYGRLVA